MCEVIIDVVKLTFGLLADEIRDGIAERLKDGDVTDEECRRLIVRELDDIKSKLNGLARKDLLSSFLFLQEGVNRLFQSLLQVDLNENIAESPDQATLLETASFKNTGSDYSMNETIALINAMASLKIRFNDRLKSAIESFKHAREKATEAFANEALPIEDRIQASQVRMVARILENLEDPEASVSDCLQYLKQLHDIGAIREIFSTLNYGGMKSRFNKTKRMNNATSVQVLNRVLFEFIEKFTKSLLAKIFAWPTISLGEKNFHPLWGRNHLSEKFESSGVEVMSLDSNFTFNERILSRELSVVNSKGNIVALAQDKCTFKVFKRSGESRILCEVPIKESRAFECFIKAMDIDAKDNLYVITATPDGTTGENKSCNFKLFSFDKNGNKKVESLLPFDETFIENVYHMAIHKDGFKIAIVANSCLFDSAPLVIMRRMVLYIGNVNVDLNSVIFDKRVSVHNSDFGVCTVQFSSFDGTIVLATSETVYIYTENGELHRKIDQGSMGAIWSVAINHTAKRILFYTSSLSSGINLLSFTQTGELKDSACLGSRNRPISHPGLISHPNGPIALVHNPLCSHKTRALLLQL